MLNLVKLCVGVATLEEFFAEIAEENSSDALNYQANAPRKLLHVTRQRPRRADEILAGGSLYWTISGRILCRQPILALEAVRGQDGVERCAIVLSREVRPTRPVPRRPFQGWRYLEAKDAPPDLEDSAFGGDSLPEDLRRRLGEFGVL